MKTKVQKTQVFLMKKATVLLVILLAAIIGTYILNQHIFPPLGVSCFTTARSKILNDERIVPVDYKNVSHFRCSNNKSKYQYEMIGKDINGDTFYLHYKEYNDLGNRSSSGGGWLQDRCYKRNDILIYSSLEQTAYYGEGSCTYQEEYTTSNKYEYFSP